MNLGQLIHYFWIKKKKRIETAKKVLIGIVRGISFLILKNIFNKSSSNKFFPSIKYCKNKREFNTKNESKNHFIHSQNKYLSINFKINYSPHQNVAQTNSGQKQMGIKI